MNDFEAGTWKSEYTTKEKPDMSLSAMPRFDLLHVDRYHALTIQFARGCPFNCEFCDIIVVYGRRPRVKGVEQMMKEIHECHRLGAKQVFLVDDNFIGNKKLAKELLRAMAAWGKENGYPVDFNTEVSLNVAQDEELLGLLREANGTTVFIGIESPRVASLEETRKTQNTRGDLVEAVHKVHEYGLQVQAGMIVGFDNDDPAIFEEQLRFSQEARIPVSMTGMLQAMPETPLHARMVQEGRLISESTGDQFEFSNIEPKGMTRLELYRGYRRLLEQLYTFRYYRERTLALHPRPWPPDPPGTVHPRRRRRALHPRDEGAAVPRRTAPRTLHAAPARSHAPAATVAGQGRHLLRPLPQGLLGLRPRAVRPPRPRHRAAVPRGRLRRSSAPSPGQLAALRLVRRGGRPG